MSRNKLCFVIGPIGRHKSPEREHADMLLRKIIRPTFATHFKDYEVVRADKIARPGMIDSQVITLLIEADIVVADLSMRNANAFYELGIRHYLQKPVLHMYRRGEDPPADISNFRATEFAYGDKWEIRDAKQQLRRSVLHILSPDFVVENPVTRSDGFLRLSKGPPGKRGRVKLVAARDVPRSLRVDDAPGLVWKRGKKWNAFWRADPAIAKKGFRPAEFWLWEGNPAALTPEEQMYISETTNKLHYEMAVFNRGRSPRPDRVTNAAES